MGFHSISIKTEISEASMAALVPKSTKDHFVPEANVRQGGIYFRLKQFPKK